LTASPKSFAKDNFVRSISGDEKKRFLTFFTMFLKTDSVTMGHRFGIHFWLLPRAESAKVF
jgi:hypothetical protein